MIMGDDKKNKLELFRSAGRPRHYDSPEEMETVVVNYFLSFIASSDLNAEELSQFRPPLGTRPTVTGLALYLGFADRKSLYEYRDNYDGYCSLIKKALTLIEMNYEERLGYSNYAGAIFALKNMGWDDKSIVENTGLTERGEPKFDGITINVHTVNNDKTKDDE